MSLVLPAPPVLPKSLSLLTSLILFPLIVLFSLLLTLSPSLIITSLSLSFLDSASDAGPWKWKTASSKDRRNHYSKFFIHYTHPTDDVYRFAYEHVIGTLSHKMDKTRSDVKKIAKKLLDHAAISPSPSPSLESAPGADYSMIPLEPRRDQFLNIKHWTPETWMALRHRKKDGTSQSISDINTLFWEDQNGNPIPPSQRPRVTRDMRAIWQDMYDNGKHLDSASRIGWEVRQEFRVRMEKEHPWLRLCADHWKVDQLWINYYSGWTPAARDKGKQPESLKRELSTEDDAAAGPSKKLKTTVQRPRPIPMRKPTAKVSPVLFPFVHPYRC